MKNILVIGGSSGIGKSVAAKLHVEGNNVFSSYRSNNYAVDGINCFPLDVFNEQIDLGFLPQQLHGLVYCPGSISLRPFNRISSGDFLNDFNLQVGGFIRVLQAVLPKMKGADGASVVLFSSVAAGTGLPFHTQVSATKGAIESLTRALAAEYAPTIRFNCIAPSLTDTPLAASLLSSPEKREANAQRHPMKKIGSPEDIANAACFLLSEESGWMTGQVMRVDGGISVIR